ncbi:MAG: MinD/ParA family protein [Thermodesulfobacteriota bacterium]
MTRLLTITSGKGGVGKTNISINLALYLAARGLRVCLFDADLGLANINVLLGIYPRETLRDVLFGRKSMQEILIRYEGGIDILPGSSGVADMVDLDQGQVEKLIRSFLAMENYDFFLFDTSAGIAKDVLAFCLAAPELLVVITPEPTSLTDAYALVKILVHSGYQGKIRVAVNLCKNASLAKSAYGKFKAAVKKFLGVDVTSLGMIYEDEVMTQAVTQQKPVATLYPKTYAAQGIKKLADRLIADTEDSLDATGIKAFWEKCLAVLKHPPHYGNKLKMEAGAEGKDGPPSPAAGSNPAPVEPIQAATEIGPHEPAGIAGKTTENPLIPPFPAEHKPAISNQTRDSGPVRIDSGAVLTGIGGEINKTLTAIVEELTRVRQSMEKLGSVSIRDGRITDSRSGATPHPESITLDFEAYSKRRQ